MHLEIIIQKVGDEWQATLTKNTETIVGLISEENVHKVEELMKEILFDETTLIICYREVSEDEEGNN